jgi:competence protein ComEA
MKMIKTMLSVCLLAFSAFVWAGHVDINKADAETLAVELKGVGIKKAQAIVDYRKVNGVFKTVEDLANVRGISDKTIEKNRDNILLGKK